MKKTLQIILWIMLAAIVVMTVIAIRNMVIKNRYYDGPFASHEFSQTLDVQNNTDYRADTICLHLAEMLEMDTLNLMLVYIPKHINPKEIEFYAIVQMLPFNKNQFLILLTQEEMSLAKLKTSLAHEFVHIGQYIDGDLVMYPNYAIWKGEDIYFGEVEYADRPFEKEAFAKQNKIVKELNKVLYE